MSGFRVNKVDGSPLWSIASPGYFSPKLNAVARSVPGMRWDGKLRAHVGYPDAVELVVDGLRALGLKSEDAPVNKRRWKHNLPVSYDGSREYQKEGIDFLITLAISGALLADDMGVGKSYQAAKAVRALRRKTIIVCQAHVRGVWERLPGVGDKGGELAKWWPNAKVFAPYGVTPREIPADADVVVIHYDIVHAWVEVLLAWSKKGLTIVFDEIQVLLNPTSRRSEACRLLAFGAKGRIGLTGTPPVERVRDLYNIVETLSPGRFGEFFPYASKYCDAKQIEVPGPENTTKKIWNFNGKSNLKELRRRLEWFSLRRTKREVLPELPPLQRQIIDVAVPAQNRIAMNAAIVKDKRRMRAALDAAADGKFKHVLEVIRGDLEAGHKIVVGTYRRAVCERFCDEVNKIAPAKFIHGGIPITRRGKIIDSVRKIDGPCCLVANIDCTSTGIDFTFADVGIVAELVWEARELAQWEARMHRMGQSEHVFVKYVIARGTGDELILHGVIGKLENHLELIETDKGDGLKQALKGENESEKGLLRLAAALKKMGEKEARSVRKKTAEGRAAE